MTGAEIVLIIPSTDQDADEDDMEVHVAKVRHDGFDFLDDFNRLYFCVLWGKRYLLWWGAWFVLCRVLLLEFYQMGYSHLSRDSWSQRSLFSVRR